MNCAWHTCMMYTDMADGATDNAFKTQRKAHVPLKLPLNCDSSMRTDPDGQLTPCACMPGRGRQQHL